MAVNSLIDERGAGKRSGRWPIVLPGLVGVVVFAFLLAPGSLDHKAHLALHGLCAQRPSHTFLFDGRLLPFDARMTGIYGGFLVATGYLLARGRFRAFAVPPRSVLGWLVGGVAAMAIDGTNSLLVDLGLPHPYEPNNALRLMTGAATGTALAAMLCFLVATTLWRRGEWQRAAIERPRELLLIGGLQVPFGLAVGSGWGVFYGTLTVALLAAAIAVVAAMALVVLLIARRTERSFERVRELEWSAVAALLLAVAVMAALSGGRVLLERSLGAPVLT